MGLIKTAIMTGGGIYAINKIAKTAENRHQNYQPNNQNTRGNGYANGNDGNWGPPPPPRGPPQNDYRYGDYPQDRQWNPSDNSNDTRFPRGYSSADFEDSKYQNAETDYQYQSRNRQALPPPSYYPQQGYSGSQNYDQSYDQSQNQNQNRGRGSPDVAALADMAMGFVGRKNSGSKGKGNMMSEFLGK